MSVVRSKICGITRIEDALAAVEAGADAIGFVFYAKSPRAVTALQARAIIAALPPFVTTVGLFVNASVCELNETLDAVPLDLLQFHGDETPEQCQGYHRPYIKALRVTRHGRMIVLDIRASAFLHHMVRNIAGVLMTIGTGERPVEWIKEVLESRTRRSGGVTAHPYGLYLVQVEYRDEFQLPERYIGPHFLTGFTELDG